MTQSVIVNHSLATQSTLENFNAPKPFSNMRCEGGLTFFNSLSNVSYVIFQGSNLVGSLGDGQLTSQDFAALSLESAAALHVGLHASERNAHLHQQGYAPVAISEAGAAPGTAALGCDAPAAAAGVVLGTAAMGMYHSGPNPACALAASLKGGCMHCRSLHGIP